MAMTFHALTDDFAFEDIEREQGGDAMALIIVGHNASTPLLHRQSRLGAVVTVFAFPVVRECALVGRAQSTLRSRVHSADSHRRVSRGICQRIKALDLVH
jgi:hypothetical protein